MFDALPERAALDFSSGKVGYGGGGRGGGTSVLGGKRFGEGGEVRHQDAKRLLLAMRAREGQGGDGTVVYYIVQEGEVKPRQN